MIPYRYTVYSSCQREAHSLWRTTRSHETVFCGFILYGKRTTHLTRRTVDESGAESTEELHFFYEEQSVPTFAECNGVKYHYIHNSRGDIVGIVDSAGNLVVEYKYDAWGKPLSITGTLKTTLGRLNPLRYRGHVYDSDSGFYYLRTRYYAALLLLHGD